MASLLAVGSEAPDFEGLTQSGAVLRLRDLRGSWVVLYFYPKDQTYNCTIEACGYRDEYREFAQEGAVVLGVSKDDVAAHAAFAKRRHLPFALVADPKQKIMGAYGAKRWYGWARRTTYLIDPEGTIRKVYPRVKARDHAERVLSDLRALKGEQGIKVLI